MAIIIKKRNAGSVPTPDPVVPREPAPVEATPVKAPADLKARQQIAREQYLALPIETDHDKYFAAPRGSVRAPEPTACSFCGHAYAFPCHGKRDNCMNAKWLREQKETA